MAPHLDELLPYVDKLQHLKWPLITNIPVQMNDGTIRHFGGVQSEQL